MIRALAAELGTENLTIVARSQESDDMLIAADRNPNTTGAKLILQDADPAGKLDTIRESIRSGHIKAVIVASEDLTEAAAFSSEDLDALELIISLNTSANATAQASEHCLPHRQPS